MDLKAIRRTVRGVCHRAYKRDLTDDVTNAVYLRALEGNLNPRCVRRAAIDALREITKPNYWRYGPRHCVPIEIAHDVPYEMPEVEWVNMSALTPRQYQCLYAIYWLGEKARDLAKAWGVTEFRISQIRSEALNVLRSQYHDRELHRLPRTNAETRKRK